MSSNTNSKNKAMTWQALCLMAYTVVWGFGNTVNGFANQGLKVVVSWMILFLFYFIPYTLMVGEMGATFENGAGGVSSWIKETMSSKLAFFAGWTFWVVNIPYLAQKPQNILIAMGWAIFQNDQLTTMISPMMLQLISLWHFHVLHVVCRSGCIGFEAHWFHCRFLYVHHEHPLCASRSRCALHHGSKDLLLQPQLGYVHAELQL